MKYMDIKPARKKKVKTTVMQPKQRPVARNTAMYPNPEYNNNIVVA